MGNKLREKLKIKNIFLIILLLIINENLYAEKTFNLTWIKNNPEILGYRYSLSVNSLDTWNYTESNSIEIPQTTKFPLYITVQQTLNNSDWSKSTITKIEKSENGKLLTQEIKKAESINKNYSFSIGFFCKYGYALEKWGPAYNNSFKNYSRSLIPIGVKIAKLNNNNESNLTVNYGGTFEIIPFDLNLNNLATNISLFPEIEYRFNNFSQIYLRPEIDILFSGLKDNQALIYPLYINNSNDFSLTLDYGITCGYKYITSKSFCIESGLFWSKLARNSNLGITIGIEYLI